MPIDDDLKIGHKYPFNACEILCSENSFIIDEILDNTKLANEDDDSDDSNIFKENYRKTSEDDLEFDKNSKNVNESDNSSDDSDTETFLGMLEILLSRKKVKREG